MTFRELHEVFNRCCTSRNKEKIWEMDKEVAYHSIIERYEDSKTEKCDCIILIYDKILIGGLYRPDAGDLYMYTCSDWGRDKKLLYKFLSNYDIKNIWNDPEQEVSISLTGMGTKNLETQLHDISEILGLVSLTGYKIRNKEQIADHIFFEIETYIRDILNQYTDLYNKLNKLECYDEIMDSLKKCTEKIESIRTPFKERLYNIGCGIGE